MKSVSKKRQEQLKRAATSAAQMPVVKPRCRNHPDRYCSVIDKCWECQLGTKQFTKHLNNWQPGKTAAEFYQPGGPGYAGKD
jgi:hypothetical protein